MKNLLIIILFVSVFLPELSLAGNQSYTYREVTGEESKEFSWQLLENGNQVMIIASAADEKLVNICREDGGTLRWHVEQGTATNLQAERIGNTIFLRGRFQGKIVDKSIDIDDRPWFQPLSYSLRTFSGDDRKNLSFWTIRMDTLELVAMQAERWGMDVIQIAGKEIRARRVEIRKDGFFSAIWSANYWFRADDNIFVQYRGTHGFPGTPETRVTLFNADSAQADFSI